MLLTDNQSVSAFEAKTHLSQILAQVQQGHRIIITKHNTPIAQLVPIASTKRDINEVVQAFKAARHKLSLQELSIQSLKETGRR
jgi:prevent-host-death family protein